MSVYYATLQPADEGGFVVRFPAIPGAATQGENVAQALVMAADCLRTHLLGLMVMGESIPEPGVKPRGRMVRAITLPALDGAKIELYRTFRASGMKKARLAAGMGIPRAHVDRLFDLNHASRLDQLEAACRVLGKTLVVELKDAA